MSQPVLLLQTQPQPQASVRQRETIIVPPRVNIAIHVITMFNAKTAPTIMPTGGYGENPGSLDKVDGPILTTAEALARDAACHLLQAYLKGDYATDAFERPILAKQTRRSKQARPRETNARMLVHEIRCPKCQGQNFADCDLCGGEGEMLMMRRKDVAG